MRIVEALRELLAAHAAEPVPKAGEYGIEWTVRKHEYRVRLDGAFTNARAALAEWDASQLPPEYGRWTCPECGKSILRGMMARHPDDCMERESK
jgi:hypothetical protein